jgi:hypothetical protein
MKEHHELVSQLAKPGQEIIDELTPMQAYALHMAIGVSGEAGELLDTIKKFAIYQKPLDFTNLIEELGDIEFYKRAGQRPVTQGYRHCKADWLQQRPCQQTAQGSN